MTRERTYRLLTFTPWLVLPALAVRVWTLWDRLPACIAIPLGRPVHWSSPRYYVATVVLATIPLLVLATWNSRLQKHFGLHDLRVWLVPIAYNGFMVVLFMVFDRTLRANAYGVTPSPLPAMVGAGLLLAFILGVALGAPRTSPPAKRRLNKELL